VNLRREALGIEIHEQFWDYILDAPLPSDLAVADAFKVLAEHIRAFPNEREVPAPRDYFQTLADAMIIWAGLFD
jgi:hypothetical protein